MAQPNILILLTDQQRKDSLGCYGNRHARTPNLDALAARGVRFEGCHVANPICMPNRLSIFTGRHPHQHGLWTNGVLLPREVPTLADHLGGLGYETASIGKIHFTPYGGDGGNPESCAFWQKDPEREWNGPYFGFQHVELTLEHVAPLAHYGRWFREHGGTADMLRRHPVAGAMESGVLDMPSELHDSSFVGERACHWLRKGRDPGKPFFLVASFPDPHHPFDPPREIADGWRNAEVPTPVGGPEDLETRPARYRKHYEGAWSRRGIGKAHRPNGVPGEEAREILRHTHAMVELVDRNVGRILETLEALGLSENTLILFTSDHGELLGDHGLWYKGPFFYQGLLNVPLLLSFPGRITPGVSRDLVSSVDLAATLCGLTGQPAPTGSVGIPWDPEASREGRGRKRCLVTYRNGYGENDLSCAVLIEDGKKLALTQDGDVELTDLAGDPNETSNLGDRPEWRGTVEALRGRLLQELLSGGSREHGQIAQA